MLRSTWCTACYTCGCNTVTPTRVTRDPLPDLLALPCVPQVHGFWQVQDTVMALTAREEVCPRSSFSLALAGAPLDPLVDLKSLRGLRPGSVLRLVEGSVCLLVSHSSLSQYHCAF